MTLDQLFEARRSIRSYKAGTQIAPETVKELIHAALQAPTWKNSETGRYYAVLDPELLARVKAECLPVFNANNVKDAPCLIVTTFVSAVSGFEKDGTATNERGDEWGAFDLGLQTENLMLKAAELGLDTLVMGIRDAAKLSELLGIPAEEKVMAVLGLGYRAIEPKKPVRKELDAVLVIK